MKNNKEIPIDPGAEFASDIEAALMDLDFPNEAADMLLKSFYVEQFGIHLPPLLKSYELPDHLEELITLREERYQIFIMSGVQESVDKKSISFVGIIMPLAPWEYYKYTKKEYKGEKPEWIPDLSYEELMMIADDLSVGFTNPLRFYYPVLAEYVEDPFSNKKAYENRRKAIVATIELLYKNFNFQVRYSESGDIPKEVSEEWLSKEVKEDYNDHMLYLDEQIKKEPEKAVLYYEKAGLLLSRERNHDALVFLRKAIELDPELPQVWYLLSDVYTKMDRDDDAKEADEKARAVQGALGMPENRGDIYYLLNPLRPSYHEIKDTDSFQVRERFECIICSYDYLYVKEGIWYACNACGWESAIPDASMAVEIRSQDKNLGSDWAQKMVLDVTLRNKTEYDITLSTEDFELCIDTVEDVDINEVEEEDFKSFCFAHMLEPYTQFKLGPRETNNLKIFLKDMKWYEEVDKERLSSGKYVLYLFLGLDVEAPWDKIRSNCESNTLFIHP